MNIFNVIDKNPLNNVRGSLGNTLITAVSSSPLAALMKPVNEFRVQLTTRQGAYDAINVGLMNVNPLWENMAELEINPDDFDIIHNRNVSFEINDEEAQMLMSALIQAKRLVHNETAESETSTGFTFTSSSGVAYTLRLMDADDIPTEPTDEGFVNYPVIFVGRTSSNVEFTVPLLTQTCLNGVIKWEMSRFAYGKEFSIYSEHSVLNYRKDQVESIGSVLKSLVASSELNAALIDTCTAISAGRISNFLQTIQSAISSKTKAVRKFFQGLGQAYSTGGIKGAIYYVLSFAKITGSVATENGILRFSDNNALIPTEYIAGIVATIVTTLVSLVGVIITIFSKTIGLLISVLGTVASGLINSINFDRSQTRASLTVCRDEQELVSLLPVQPIALFRGQADILTSSPTGFGWYLQCFENGQSVVSVDVIGGSVIVGPGEMGSDGKPTKVRWEFHPCAIPLRIDYYHMSHYFDHLTRGCFTPQSTQYATTSARAWSFYDIIRNGSLDLLTNIWECITQNCFKHDMLNGDDGALSHVDDAIMWYSTVMYCALFLSSVVIRDGHIQSLVRSSGVVLTTTSSDQKASDYQNDVDWLFGVAAGLVNASSLPIDPGTNNYYTDWARLISFCSSLSTDHVDLHLFEPQSTWDVELETWWHAVETYSISGNSEHANTLMGYGTYFGSPMPAPESIVYALQVPKYNSKSFWTWLGLAIGVTVAVTAATALIAYKVHKFKMNKRAENVAKFNATQSSYQEAVSGIKSHVDPATGQMVYEEFDVSSPEGQAYISQCYKDYRITARSNNIWANIIGGTRYDVSTFYGEKETEDSAGIIESIQDNSILTNYGFNDGLNDAPAADGIARGDAIIIKLIKGDLA